MVVPSKTNLLPVVDLEVAVQCVLAFAFAIAFLLELTRPFPAGDWRICDLALESCTLVRAFRDAGVTKKSSFKDTPFRTFSKAAGIHMPSFMSFMVSFRI